MIKSVERRFRRAITHNKLVRPSERIAIAVSGGKDSVACMHLLANYCRGKRCDVVALSIDEGIKGYRGESLQIARENAETLGLEHYVVSFKRAFTFPLDRIVKLATKMRTGLKPCTYCGVLRRSLLNQAARELGADKLATGHNLDDETQAIMLNYIRADLPRLYRLGPAYSPRDGFVPRIKPLREIPEKEVAVYALLKGIRFHLDFCSYAHGIHVEIRDFLNQLETNHPNSKFMILRMFERLKPHLAKAVPIFEMQNCETCGEPASSKMCKSCELLQNIGLKRKQKTLISDSSR